ncbi:hypothetical protein SNE40_014555 [Patella caerulea]|uniref:Uncharacterized protein n=1 Tax=Patella caerulea TaxID=87958 RepID=A0AAN8PTI2_PATCE
MSMRRKLWKQNRKLQRGLTCDQILFPGQPAPAPRRLSSGSLTSGSEENENEPDPPVVRRGRRAAIFETKNCGDVSPTTLSPEVSPSNSCDEGEGATNIAGRLRRRRSSVDLAMNIYPGDLLVQEHHKKLIKRNTIADFYAGRNGTTGGPVNPEDPNKKGRQPFSLLKLVRGFYDIYWHLCLLYQLVSGKLDYRFNAALYLIRLD